MYQSKFSFHFTEIFEKKITIQSFLKWDRMSLRNLWMKTQIWIGGSKN